MGRLITADQFTRKFEIMKRKLFLATFMSIFICSLAISQRGNRNSNCGTTYTTYSYNENYYDDYRDRPNFRREYDRYYSKMNRADRRRVNELLDRLHRTERRAWEDGYLSRRDRNRIVDVEQDIDRIFLRYRRDRNNRYYRSGRNNNRYQTGCR